MKKKTKNPVTRKKSRVLKLKKKNPENGSSPTSDCPPFPSLYGKRKPQEKEKKNRKGTGRVTVGCRMGQSLITT